MQLVFFDYTTKKKINILESPAVPGEGSVVTLHENGFTGVVMRFTWEYSGSDNIPAIGVWLLKDTEFQKAQAEIERQQYRSRKGLMGSKNE